MKKPRKPKASPAVTWTETDLSGEQFLALCERERRGELRLTQCGVGSSNAAWNVKYCPQPAKVPLPVDFSGAKPWR